MVENRSRVDFETNSKIKFCFQKFYRVVIDHKDRTYVGNTERSYILRVINRKRKSL